MTFPKCRGTSVTTATLKGHNCQHLREAVNPVVTFQLVDYVQGCYFKNPLPCFLQGTDDVLCAVSVCPMKGLWDSHDFLLCPLHKLLQQWEDRRRVASPSTVAQTAAVHPVMERPGCQADGAPPAGKRPN